METKHFAIKDVDTGSHIGCLGASTDQELKQKAIKACGEHFCADEGKIHKRLKMSDYMDGKSGTFLFTNDDNEHNEIFIEQSWIY